MPWLLGWPYPDLDPDLRKAFEVALHAGTAVGLLIALRDEVAEAFRDLDARRVTLIAGSFVPPAIVGLHARAADRAPARDAPARSPSACCSGRRR